MLVHLLAERNLISLDDAVCDYIPEFGVHGKQWITIRHVLTHRAGIPNLPPEALNPDVIGDPRRVLELVCEARPVWRPGRVLAYHAISGGFVLGEVIRRVTGRDPREFLDDALCRPLGFRYVRYGLAPADLPALAHSYVTGPPSALVAPLLMRRALGVPYEDVARFGNDPRFHAALIPSANVVATAEEMSRFYQLLLDGGILDGVRVFDPRTVRRATTEQSYLELDFTLVLPVRYGMGFMLGAEWFSPYGPYTRRAFGHIGFTNIICWADPERQVAAAVMTSGKPLLYPDIYRLWEVMYRIGLACPREPGRALPGAAAPPCLRAAR
jgi:CubicO group peptidase (beta-lactamase class C family)